MLVELLESSSVESFGVEPSWVESSSIVTRLLPIVDVVTIGVIRIPFGGNSLFDLRRGFAGKPHARLRVLFRAKLMDFDIGFLGGRDRFRNG